MKKTIALILLIGSLFVAGIVFFLYTKSIDPTNISLIKEEGKVYFKEAKNSDYQEVFSDEQVIKSGSFIKTDAESYARVFLPDNSLISIDQSSEIQITYEGNKTFIEQLLGKTWHRVQTVANGGEYKVQTANTAVNVEGTIFSIVYDEDGTSNVNVEENKVNVKSIDEEKKVNEEYSLQPGDRTDIPKNVKDKIKKYLMDDVFKATDWYKRNKLVDDIYKKLSQDQVKNLRSTLRQKLEESPDFDRFHFGLRTPVPSFIKFVKGSVLNQPDTNQIREDLADLYKLEKITENVCTDIPPQELAALTSNVQKYQQYISNSAKVLDILKTLKDGCKGEILSVEAAEKLKTLTQ